MGTYDRDYSVVEIKKFLAWSEANNHPWNNADHGHAHSLHHAISDSDVISKNKSAFIMSTGTNAFFDNFDPAQIGEGLRIKTKTVFDQPFMIAAILNSSFGQQALKFLNSVNNVRLTIHAQPASTGVGAMKMRTSGAGGKVDASKFIRHVVIILDNKGKYKGEDYLHFVTAFPTLSQQYKFKTSPFPRTAPGIEVMQKKASPGTQRWVWSLSSQTDSGGKLMPA